MSRPPGRAVDLSVDEQFAIRSRISHLRSEISRAEREVEALKETLGRSKRPGLVGVAARAAETLVARFDRSFTVLKRQVEKQADPIGFLALDTLAGLRRVRLRLRVRVRVRVRVWVRVWVRVRVS